MKDTGTQLTFKWIDGTEPLQNMAGEWAALATRTGADIYATPVWVLTWWAHFGRGKALRTLAAYDIEGQLVALLPFMIHSVRVGPVRIRIAKLAATDPNTVILRLAAEEQVLVQCLAEALSGLCGDSHAHVISFSPASERGTILAAIRDAVALDYNSSALTVSDTPLGTHTIFELPASFDNYLADLSKKRRSQYRRDLKHLQKDHGLTTRLTYPGSDQFKDFVGFHNRQWQEIGKGGHFVDWPGSVAFYSDLAEATVQSHETWFIEQLGQDGPLATQFCLVSGYVCHWRLPARSIDPELERLSLGKIGLIQMIEQLISAGVTRIEAGIGAYGYKLVYGGESVPTHRLIVSRQSAWSSFLLKLCLGWSRLLHLAYYRLWFGRIAPRLRSVIPLGHKPLWSSWIRTRI